MSKGKKNKVKGNKLSARQLRTEVLKLFRRHPKKQLNPKQVARKLKVANSKDSVLYALESLAKSKQLIALGDYKFKLDRAAHAVKTNKSTTAIGKVDMTRSGSAYIICEDREDDVHVAAKNLNTALDGDKVKIRVWTPRGRRRAEGEVEEVMERATSAYIGTYWQYPRSGIIVPDGNKVSRDVQVENDLSLDAKDGEKVVFAIIGWTKDRLPTPIGKVTTVLGKAGSNDIEMKSILVNNGFELVFPESVMVETSALHDALSEAELAKRRDLRSITTFTIDPDTAKDFDDALSYQKLENGHVEIGVHIADVSHFVKPNSALDKEAYSRSTSVYLVDRVLPMLPEKLSNALCSLRPHEDKFTFSAIFTFDGKGKIKDRWFGKTIIHSDRRFTYEEAQEVIEAQKGDFASEIADINRLAHILRKQKFNNGAIAFESDEVKFRLDENAVPVEVYVKERKEAHMLIEDFMLLANREVATFIQDKSAQEGAVIPFVYRIHDEPDQDRVAELAGFARNLGFEMDVSSPEMVARSYNRMVKAAAKDSGLKILQEIAIRTMAKAAYSTQNIGHYGLAFANYSHFTSPIRRYSDVLVHRLLEKNIVGTYRTNAAKLEEQCQHISLQERRAMEAERESVKYKQVEFIQNHIGETFDGLISGIIDSGIFVELVDSRCEGMIPFHTMDEPFMVADSRLYLEGQRSGKRLRMGDKIRVKVVDADLSSRKIDMAYIPG
ncbi:MAG: ribonuclease R [Saprospiraceae bacterium]|nr:ribonuclease R [Saprospiraceae bacterium]